MLFVDLFTSLTAKFLFSKTKLNSCCPVTGRENTLLPPVVLCYRLIDFPIYEYATQLPYLNKLQEFPFH